MSELSAQDVYDIRWTLLFKHGLYKTAKYSLLELPRLAEEDDGCDAHCVGCGKESTMRAVRTVERQHTDYRGVISTTPFLEVEVACMRNGHRMRFYFVNDNESLTKIGQHPSLADIAKGDLGRIRRVMDEQDQDDLVRADGLHAHGIGAGSFVYLRRIVERLVVKAEGVAGITESGARFVERIKTVGKYLPPFLVENAYLHGILSKGVHELNEDECEGVFPAVRAGIKQVFVDLRAKLDTDEARDETSKVLSALNRKYAQTDAKAHTRAKPANGG
jgi:hypothetical protein